VVNKLFLATDNKGRTVFHVAVTSWKLEVFQGIFNLAKENQTTEEVNKFLLATDSEGRTVICEARNFFTLEVFQGVLN
jgi:hypothetical protein